MTLIKRLCIRVRSLIYKVLLGSEGIMTTPYVFVNGARVYSSSLLANSLTDDAKKKSHVDLDIAVITTDLATAGIEIVTPTTFSLTFYVVDTLDVSKPVSAPVCVASSWVNQGEYLDIYSYASGKYAGFKAPFDPSLKGVLGCTGAAVLGFYLLKELVGIETDRLGILNLVDKSAIDRIETFGLPVGDEDLIEFCRARGFAKIYAGPQESDCDNWVACKAQPGVRCNLRIPKCVNKA